MPALAAWQVYPAVHVDDVVQVCVQIFEVDPERERHTRGDEQSASPEQLTPCVPELPG